MLRVNSAFSESRKKCSRTWVSLSEMESTLSCSSVSLTDILSLSIHTTFPVRFICSIFIDSNLADNDDKRLQNVKLALDLVVEAGCQRASKVRARYAYQSFSMLLFEFRDIVSGDVKSIMRVIYSIYEKFAPRS